MSRQKAENEIFTLSDEAVQKRFWSRVRRTDDADSCWEWIGHIGTHGYGRLTVHYRELLAHRVAYVLANGAIPGDLFVLHKCDNPACCRPDHLSLGTPGDNSRDMAEKGRAATGLANGNYTKPWRRATGERHWSRTNPELVPKGESVYSSRLTEADVLDIRRRYDAGEANLASLAKQYGMSKQGIWLVAKRRNWKHLP